LYAGNYSITLTDSMGCVKQESYSVTRQEPLAIKLQTNNVFDCDARFVKQTFVAQVSGGIAPYKYNWLSGEICGLNNEIMTTNQNGIVVLKVEDGLKCESSYNLNVKTPILGFPGYTSSSIGLSSYGIYSIKDPIEFTNKAIGDFESIGWDFGDGSVSTEISPKHSYLKEGIYSVVQTVKYPFGCNYFYTTTIKVEKGYEVVVPNAFTPNNNRLNDTFRPVFRGLSNIKMEVFNTWGGLLYSEEGTSLQGWTGEINNRFVESGNYYYKVIATIFYGEAKGFNGPFILAR
jgi:large repetitive protein